ncbi:MAG: sterol desaturase family protein [Polyangiaceae bacterium]|nr:sterol desaturase family protein [Myxococcales bacterium]MCB9587557.1 sterol desaturase family protein [Polyangiaceae bacterium]MCB9605646.1 sterol desaturase family protein [Polyangiaceae bacterium]
MAVFDFTDEFQRTVDRWDGTIGPPSAENRKLNRIRVYKNGFVEHVLASSHPLLPGVWFGWAVVYGGFLTLSSAPGRGGRVWLFAGGVLGFSLLEYLLHRFAFHWDPGDDRRAKVRLFLMHGLHHEFPNDKRRLVAPPLMSWPIAAILFALYWLLLDRNSAFVLFGGTCAGYLAYDWIHYYTHHFRSPKTRVGKLLRRAHAVHHFKLPLLNMGISSPLWDWVFGTFAWSEETMRAALRETKAAEAESDAAERREPARAGVGRSGGHRSAEISSAE